MKNKGYFLGEQAKNKLGEFVGEIDRRLNVVWKQEIEKRFGFGERQELVVRESLEHAAEHNLRSAKRIRGAFVKYGYELGGEESEKIWQVSMGVELIHTALLMHDDFMDEDEVRRGKPTTHKLFGRGDKHRGESIAVSIGDAVLCLGFELISRAEFEANILVGVINEVMRAIANTAWGQVYDVRLTESVNWTEKEVLALHRAKTGIYTYQNPLVIGARLAGLGDDVIAVLTEYADKGGVAFQLQDDILGLYGDEEKTGKSANSDLLQGKCTLLVLKGLELGNAEERRQIEKVWGKKTATENDLNLAKKAIRNSGSYEYSRKLAIDLAREAVESVEKLRSMNLRSESIDFIQGVAEYMVNREV